MRPDRYTKAVLTAIAVFLGILALERAEPHRAAGDDSQAAQRTRDIRMSMGEGGFLVYDTRWGDFAFYGTAHKDNGDRLQPSYVGTALSIGAPIELGKFAGISREPPASQPGG